MSLPLIESVSDVLKLSFDVLVLCVHLVEVLVVVERDMLEEFDIEVDGKVVQLFHDLLNLVVHHFRG